MSYRPKYLGHVNIYVRDVERLHRWYEDVLGLQTYDYRPDGAAFNSADMIVFARPNPVRVVAFSRHLCANEDKRAAWECAQFEPFKPDTRRLS
jgi:catechol 2,3-dioxygenase-like lactoylglutathione lyase family enzyme